MHRVATGPAYSEGRAGAGARGRPVVGASLVGGAVLLWHAFVPHDRRAQAYISTVAAPRPRLAVSGMRPTSMSTNPNRHLPRAAPTHRAALPRGSDAAEALLPTGPPTWLLPHLWTAVLGAFCAALAAVIWRRCRNRTVCRVLDTHRMQVGLAGRWEGLTQWVRSSPPLTPFNTYISRW